MRISMCHCLECQRRTGSTYGAQARWKKERVLLTGEPSIYERTGDSGGRARFFFCPNCATTLYWDNDRMPDTWAIAIGAFADPSFPAPRVSVYEDRKHPWVGTPPHVEHMA
ncbi:MAG: GFA family protein [Polyangiaceae bacterium]